MSRCRILKVGWGRINLAPGRRVRIHSAPTRGLSSTYSWAPVCAIGAAEREDVERAARQALRVLAKKDGLFEAAAIDDEDEAAALAEVHGRAAIELASALDLKGGRINGVNGASSSGSELQRRIRQSFTDVGRGLIERDTETRLLVLAALCGEHLLLLGPPGTAKSALSRQLSRALRAPYFERQLTRFSVPEELFGPLSLTELQQDRYVRKTEGYLPSCSIAFIDEIFKANSAILNSLLTIINEREFDNGNQRVHVPLICLVGASNEPPDDDELDALFDRFLLRRWVKPVSRAARPALLELQNGSMPRTHEACKTELKPFTEVEVKELKAIAKATVTIPQEVKQLIEDLLSFLDESGVYVSDRRLVKAATMLRVAAWTSGRTTVTKYDCLLLQHVFWKHPEEAEKISEWFLDYFVTPGAEVDQVMFLFSGLFKRMWRAIAKSDQTAATATKQLRQEWAQELENFKKVLVGQLARWDEEARGDAQTLSANIWQTADDMARLTQRLRPDLESRQGEVRAILQEIVALEVTLQTPAVALQPHLLASALPRQGQALANALLHADTSTSDKRNGLQLLKVRLPRQS